MNRVRFTQENSDFIRGMSSATSGWYYIPFWFKDLGDGTFEVHKLGELPNELKEKLIGFRSRVSPIDRDFPMSIEECFDGTDTPSA